MASIDNKTVQMSFDNAEFERKIGTTLKSLDQLQKSLNFANSAKSLSDLGAATRGFNLGNLGSVVDGVSAKFLAMSAIAITALSNITNRAVNAGISLAKSLSLDQIISGFHEYEINMNSIQTILSNTKADGTNLQQVNAALDELNTYADKTIYNFSEMARNIGTFTAAGVDLNTSVGAIKGIANLAAISGSNSQQASTAMYQLSQAISTGTVRLMDWNSVVNAGMGGEVFQRALFDTGKAMGKLKDVPVGMTFDEWTKSGKGFRASLEDNWLTADVLTTTLKSFAGEMTKDQLLAIGYTEDQANAMLELGKTGIDSATKVRTLTQLIGTVKEAIGSGWSSSFRIVFGDFEEATSLFTGISDAIGKMVANSADSRNKLLNEWKFMGGRNFLIEGLKSGFESLKLIIKPIQEAFRSIFPKTTSVQLVIITQRFRDFMRELSPSVKTFGNVKRIFLGLFSAMKIGWEVLKQGTKFVKSFLATTVGLGKGGFLEIFANIADFFTHLNEQLVKGEGIKKFFSDLTLALKNPAKFIQDLGKKFDAFFKNLSFEKIGEKLSKVSQSLGDFFKKLGEGKSNSLSLSVGFSRLSKVFDFIGTAIKKFGSALSWIWDRMVSFKNMIKNVTHDMVNILSNLGPNLAKALNSETFDKILDLLKTIFLGVGVGDFSKLVKNGLGLNIDLDLTGGFFAELKNQIGGVKDTIASIKKSFDGLTGVLGAMQSKLKAEALMKIAVAIGVMAAAMLVLSFIDAEGLSKSLAAMAVGFGQLVGTFALLNKVSSGPKSAATFGGIAAGFIALAGAMVIMGFAMKIISTMSWEDIAKGLTTISAILVAFVGTAKLLQDNTSGLVRAGISITLIAIAMNILAASMKIFATMSWEDMAKGLAGVAGGLTAIVLAVRNMPDGMLTKGIGILAIAVALNFLAASMKIFATMSWEDMAKGLTGVGAGLLAIALGMNAMPKTLPLTAAGLVLVSIALNAIAASLKIFATMSWAEMGKGLAAMAASLLVLSVAANSMTGTIFGSIAIGVMAGALLVLTRVLKEMGKLNLKELGLGLLAIFGVLATLGLSALALSSLAGPLFALGAALILVGGAFALFGLGASLTAEAFALIAGAGKEGISTIMDILDEFVKRIPKIVIAIVKGILGIAKGVIDGAPEILSSVAKLLMQLLDTIISVTPKLLETAEVLITALLKLIRDKSPDFIATGFELLMNFLRGMEANIGQITLTVIDIIIAFINTLTANIDRIVEAGVNFLVKFLEGISQNIGQVITAATDVIVKFLEGIAQNIGQVIAAGADLVVKFLEGIGNAVTDIITAGADIIVHILEGIGQKSVDIAIAAATMVTDFLTAIGEQTNNIVTAGTQMIVNIITGIGKASIFIASTAVQTLIQFINAIGDNTILLVNAGFQMIIDLINGLADAIDHYMPELRQAGMHLAEAILDGMSFGLLGGVKDVVGKAIGIGKSIVGGIGSFLGINSPSKVFIGIAGSMVEGLVVGFKKDKTAETAAIDFTDNLTTKFSKALTKVPLALSDIDEFNPIITPVLDLTGVKKDAESLNKLIGNSAFKTDLSYSMSNQIAATSRANAEQTTQPTAVTKEIRFEQVINAPTQLSTGDIYRQTRNQFILAKKELELA